MNIISVLCIALFSLAMNISCSAQTNNKEENQKNSQTGKVEVFYFHYTRRCATCKAVESVSRETIAELYGVKVRFADFNLDEEVGETKGKELGVSGQTLLIVAGDTKINITSEGFMNARSNPEKLKAIIKEKIDPLL